MLSKHLALSLMLSALSFLKANYHEQV